jgi:hypothetical protein
LLDGRTTGPLRPRQHGVEHRPAGSCLRSRAAAQSAGSTT